MMSDKASQKAGRPLTTGKFDTVQQLLEKCLEFKSAGRSARHCASVCGVSSTTMNKIYRRL
jgi:hypothetical protein